MVVGEADYYKFAYNDYTQQQRELSWHIPDQLHIYPNIHKSEKNKKNKCNWYFSNHSSVITILHISTNIQ